MLKKPVLYLIPITWDFTVRFLSPEKGNLDHTVRFKMRGRDRLFTVILRPVKEKFNSKTNYHSNNYPSFQSITTNHYYVSIDSSYLFITQITAKIKLINLIILCPRCKIKEGR